MAGRRTTTTTTIVQMLLLATLAVSTTRSMSLPFSDSFGQTSYVLTQNPTQQQQQQPSSDYHDTTATDTEPVVPSMLSKERSQPEANADIGDSGRIGGEDGLFVVPLAVGPQSQVVGAPLPPAVVIIPSPLKKPGLTKMKSGYSKVANSQTMTSGAPSTSTTARHNSQLEESNIIKVTETEEDDIQNSATSVKLSKAKPEIAVAASVAKSMERNKETLVDVRNLNDFDDQEDEMEDIMESFASVQDESNQPIAAKLTATNDDDSSVQPIAAQLTKDDERNNATDDADSPSNAGGSSAFRPMKPEDFQTMLKMKRKLSDYVEKHMGGVLIAEIHEVREEQRANGLQDYGPRA